MYALEQYYTRVRARMRITYGKRLLREKQLFPLTVDMLQFVAQVDNVLVPVAVLEATVSRSMLLSS